jgi:hypothetical protein
MFALPAFTVEKLPNLQLSVEILAVEILAVEILAVPI